MTSVPLKEETVGADVPLVYVRKEEKPETEVIAPGQVHSYYYQLHFDYVVTVGRHSVVRQYDPEEWPYPPEPDCQKEWDEAGK